MDKATFMLWCLLGLGLAFAIVMAIGPTRRSRVPRYVLWLLLTAGAVTCIYGLSHSTSPSFAPRVTVVGTSSALTEKRVGREGKFVFTFVPVSGKAIALETHIIVPHWGDTEIFQQRTLRVTYLDDPSRDVSNEAVQIEIVSGENAGWRDSLDARPFGVWLAVPIGAMIAGLGYIGLRYRKDDFIADRPIETTPAPSLT